MRLVVILTLFLAACSTPLEKRRAIEAGPTQGKPIVVTPFDTENVASNLPEEPQRYGDMMSEEIARSLRESMVRAKVVPGAQPTAESILIRGRIVELDGPGRAMRWVAGAFAPASVTVQGEALSGDQIIGAFTVKHDCPGIWMISDEALIEKCINWIGMVIRDMVVSGDYRSET